MPEGEVWYFYITHYNSGNAISSENHWSFNWYISSLDIQSIAATHMSQESKNWCKIYYY